MKGMRFKELQEKQRIIIIALLLGICCFLIYHFHVVIRRGTIFTHFFYIPIILAALWWKRKGLIVAIFLALLLTLSHIFLREVGVTANDYLRAGMLIIIGFVVAMLNERIAKMQEQLIRFSNAVKMSPESIVISDSEGKIVDVNEATFKMYGTDNKRDIMGKNSLDFIAPEDREKAIAGVKEAIEKGYVENQEYHIISKDGSKIPVEMSSSILKDATGEQIGFVGITRDITERKKIEETLKESEERYRDLFEND